MDSLAELVGLLRSQLVEWQVMSLAELRFSHRDAARLTLIVFAAVSVAMLLVRSTIRRRRRPEAVALPALLEALDRRSLASIRHVPVLLLAAGLPALVLAVGDPYSSLTRQRASFPGRRICLMIDGSSSMAMPFEGNSLVDIKTSPPAVFFKTVAAADRFVQLRMNSQYRDLIALIEFGNEAYVVTPFTNDYDNIRLSLSLISSPGEFARFPDPGTLIGRAIGQSIELFRTFDYLDATGNALVLFSDGEDSLVRNAGASVIDVVSAAIDAKVPIYFIRTNYGKAFGSVLPDELWRPAVERTGGRFYPAADEQSILRAIREIDRISTGRIELTQYVTQRPLFAPLALLAAALWSLAFALRLTLPHFQRFP